MLICSLFTLYTFICYFTHSFMICCETDPKSFTTLNCEFRSFLGSFFARKFSGWNSRQLFSSHAYIWGKMQGGFRGLGAGRIYSSSKVTSGFFPYSYISREGGLILETSNSRIDSSSMVGWIKRAQTLLIENTSCRNFRTLVRCS